MTEIVCDCCRNMNKSPICISKHLFVTSESDYMSQVFFSEWANCFPTNKILNRENILQY